MVMLGRDIYHDFLIRGDCGLAVKDFIRSIRFSTHGEFFCNDTGLDIINHNHPHFHEYNGRAGFYKTIIFSKNSFNIDNASCSSVMFDYDLSSLLDVDLILMNKIRFIDFIVNANGSLEYVCSLNSSGIPIHDPFFLENLLHPDLGCHINVLPGDTLTIVLYDQPKKTNHIYKNYLFRHWVRYRAIGINIPLLIIQILLGRNVRTLPLVDVKNINFNAELPVYRIEQNKMFWFDLDETLVCRSKPIWQTIELLFRLKKNNQRLGLITRHIFDIHETLKKISVDPFIFQKIVAVPVGVKKSSYIEDEEIFIDNEFPERSDVRRKSSAMVLDIDQIDFIVPL